MTLTAVLRMHGWTGIATTSRIPAIGAMAPLVGPGCAIVTQAVANKSTALKALVALDEGESARFAVEKALEGDDATSVRQTTAIDRAGNVCVFTGVDCVNEWGAMAFRGTSEFDVRRRGVFTTGKGHNGFGFAVFGNRLANDAVLQSMYRALSGQPSTTFPPYGLLIAVGAGQAVGGDKRLENSYRSAALSTWHDDFNIPLFDLRRDLVPRESDPLRLLAEEAVERTKHLQEWADEDPALKRLLTSYATTKNPVAVLEYFNRRVRGRRPRAFQPYPRSVEGTEPLALKAAERHPPGSVFHVDTLEALQQSGVSVSGVVAARDNPYRALYRSDESGTRQLWAWDRSTDERWRLTNYPKGVLSADISPDGERVVWYADDAYREQPFTSRAATDKDEKRPDVALATNLPPTYRPRGVAVGNGVVVVGIERDEPESPSDRFEVHVVQGGIATRMCSAAEPIEVASLSADEKLVATRHGDPLDCHTRVTRVSTSDIVATLRDDPGAEVTPGGFAPTPGDYRLIVEVEREERTLPAIWQPLTGALEPIPLDDERGELARRREITSKPLACWSHDGLKIFFCMDQLPTTAAYRYFIDRDDLAKLETPAYEGRDLGTIDGLNLNPTGGLEVSWSDVHHPSFVHFAVGSTTDLVIPALTHGCRVFRSKVPTSAGEIPVMIIEPVHESLDPGAYLDGLPPPPRFGGYVMVPGLGALGTADRPLPSECLWELRRGQHIIVVDHRGTAGRGRTWRAASTDSAAADVSEVVGILQQQGYLGPTQTTIFGGPEGSRIALLAAARSPEAFAKVVIREPLPQAPENLEHLTAEVRRAGPIVRVAGAGSSDLLPEVPVYQSPLRKNPDFELRPRHWPGPYPPSSARMRRPGPG